MRDKNTASNYEPVSLNFHAFENHHLLPIFLYILSKLTIIRHYQLV